MSPSSRLPRAPSRTGTSTVLHHGERCPTCHREIDHGTPAWWNRELGSWFHLHCAEKHMRDDIHRADTTPGAYTDPDF